MCTDLEYGPRRTGHGLFGPTGFTRLEDRNMAEKETSGKDIYLTIIDSMVIYCVAVVKSMARPEGDPCEEQPYQ